MWWVFKYSFKFNKEQIESAYTFQPTPDSSKNPGNNRTERFFRTIELLWLHKRVDNNILARITLNKEEREQPTGLLECDEVD